MKIIWSARASRDLVTIGDFIAKDNPTAARRHIDKLVRRIRCLKQFPNSGRAVPEIANEMIREVVENNYRLVYVMDHRRKIITALTVFESHKRLDLKVHEE